MAVGAVDAVEAVGAEQVPRAKVALSAKAVRERRPSPARSCIWKPRPPAASAFRARFSENRPTPSCGASIDSDSFRPQITSFGANHNQQTPNAAKTGRFATLPSENVSQSYASPGLDKPLITIFG